MNLLQRALIEKVGYEQGLEHVLPSENDIVHLSSARHRTETTLTIQGNYYALVVYSDASKRLSVELARSFPAIPRVGEAFIVDNLDELAHLLRRAAALAQALPDQTSIDYESQCKDELDKFSTNLIKDTEIECMVRQRVGQQIFRQAMLEVRQCWSIEAMPVQLPALLYPRCCVPVMPNPGQSVQAIPNDWMYSMAFC